uniref:Peptidase A1 domain-containing protein n=1 Tax=Angiostrongylus cantonensis TaxID=6313 RepID=A0A0K0D5D2_ANGCA
MPAGTIRYEFTGLTETRRCHSFNTVYDTGEELFLGTCDSRGVSGVGVLVNTSLSINIDLFEQFITRIGRLLLKRCGSTLGKGDTVSSKLFAATLQNVMRTLE